MNTFGFDSKAIERRKAIVQGCWLAAKVNLGAQNTIEMYHSQYGQEHVQRTVYGKHWSKLMEIYCGNAKTGRKLARMRDGEGCA
jgi:hypothetical protein